MQQNLLLIKPTRKNDFFLWCVSVCVDDAALCELISKLTNSSTVDLNRLLGLMGLLGSWFLRNTAKIQQEFSPIPICLFVGEDLSSQISRGCCLHLLGFGITKYYWGVTRHQWSFLLDHPAEIATVFLQALLKHLGCLQRKPGHSLVSALPALQHRNSP